MVVKEIKIQLLFDILGEKNAMQLVDTAMKQLKNETKSVNLAFKTLQKNMQKMGSVTPTINKVKKQVKSITDVLNQSIGKRGQFDFNKQFKFDVAGASAKRLGKDITELGKTADKSFKTMRGGLMGLAFGALFMGMAMNRAIGSFIRKTFDAYKMVGTENTIFAQKTNELSAAWEFFKFSLIDALNQSSMFITLIDLVIKLVNWFGKLDEGERTMLAMSTAIAWVITKIISLGGSIALFVIALKLVKPEIFTKLGNAIAIAKNKMILFNTALWASPLTWIAIIIITVTLLVGYLITTFDDLGTTLKFIGGFLLWTFALLGDGIKNLLFLPLVEFLKFLDVAIKAVNKITGSEFETVSDKLPDWIDDKFYFTKKAETFLGESESFKPVMEDVQEKGDFMDYLDNLGETISEAIKAGFEDNDISVTVENQQDEGFNATTS